MPDCLRYAFLRRTDVAPCGRCDPCLAGPAEPPQPTAAVETEDEEKERLTASLEARGVKVDGRWRIKRLRELDVSTPD